MVIKYKPGDILTPHPDYWSREFIAQGLKFTVTSCDGPYMNGLWSHTGDTIQAVLDDYILGLAEESVVDKILTKYNGV